MTAQIGDTCFYQDKNFTLAGINGEGLFNPKDHGLNPKSGCTACWRGYCAHYLVENRKLMLAALEISITDHQGFPDGNPNRAPAPSLNGISASLPADGELSFLEYEYEDLDLFVHFTGGLLLASGFIENLYVHMGFHPAWKYHNVHELIFESGVLQEERDVSEKLAFIREKMVAMAPERDNSMTPSDHMSWIESCFSRDYNY